MPSWLQYFLSICLFCSLYNLNASLFLCWGGYVLDPSKLRTPCNGDFFTQSTRGGGYAGSSSTTADDRIRIVMESLTTNITLAELTLLLLPLLLKYNLKPNVFYGWKQKFFLPLFCCRTTAEPVNSGCLHSCDSMSLPRHICLYLEFLFTCTKKCNKFRQSILWI